MKEQIYIYICIYMGVGHNCCVILCLFRTTLGEGNGIGKLGGLATRGWNVQLRRQQIRD